MVRVVSAAVVVVLGVVLSGCASVLEAPKGVDLFGEYTRSTNVKNDIFPSDGVSSEYRQAKFAHGTPEQVQNILLSASDCGKGYCQASSEARSAGREFGGTFYRRSILVKHDDESLELVTLYVAQKSEKDSVLIDANGGTYQDLADFQANNEVLTDSDLVLVPEHLDTVPGEGRIVTVYGHSTVSSLPWVLGGVGVLVLLVAALVGRRRVADRREAEAKASG